MDKQTDIIHRFYEFHAKNA